MTVNDGLVDQTSCSIYEPSLLAKYFHSCSTCTLAVTFVTSLVLVTMSTTFCTSAWRSSCGIFDGSFCTDVIQYSV